VLLETERLLVVACPAGFVDALPDRDVAGKVVDATVPEGFPDEELAGLLPLYRRWLQEDPGVLGFGPWLVVTRDGRELIGSAGFLGRPGEDGTIELGYSIVPDHRSRGFASEAAGALVEWALSQPGVDRVVAGCDPSNAASIRVLERSGMWPRGTRDGELFWEVERAT